MSDDLCGDAVECGDFLGGQQIDQVPADRCNVRRSGLAEDGLTLPGQADECSAGVTRVGLARYQATLFHPPEVVGQAAGRPEQLGREVAGPPAVPGFRRPDEIRGILNTSIHIDPDIRPQPDTVTGSAEQVISQLRDLLGLGFTGFNFIIPSPDRTATMQRIAEEVLPALRSTG